MTRPFRTALAPALAVFVVLALAVGGCGGETSAPEAVDAADAGDAGQGEAPEQEAPAAGVAGLGEPRDDLERFHGVYASPERPGRRWFVSAARRPPLSDAPEIPPGYLMVGALFGDVAPWPLRARSETTFEQAWVPEPQGEGLALEFETDAEGEAVALRFTQGSMKDAGRLERVGALPDALRRPE